MKHFHELINEAVKFVVVGFNNETNKDEDISTEYEKEPDAKKFLDINKNNLSKKYKTGSLKVKKVIKTYK